MNWCPALGTVLANEEVKDGSYVETGDPVERRMMRQWMLRITAYAERLLEDLEGLDWPEGVKEMQRNWIGKSGAPRSRFAVAGHDASFTVFTTRPDTLFGCDVLRAGARASAGRTITAPERSAPRSRHTSRGAAQPRRARPAPTRRRPACSPAPTR